MTLNVHRDMKHASDGKAIGRCIHMHDQVVRPDVKEAERTLEGSGEKRVEAEQFRRVTEIFQIALRNVTALAFDGRPP